jgi:hypothetical protein
MSYAMGECIFSHRRIYGCSSAGDGVRCVVQVWGIDKRGQQINAFLCTASRNPGITSLSLRPFTFYTLRIAKSAVAQALVDLGTGAHFYIASTKDEDLLRLLVKVKPSSVTHQGAPTQRACFSTDGDNYHDITRKN